MTTEIVELPLRSLHESLGATWTEVDGVRVPAHFGDAEAERALLDSGCGLWDGSGTDRLELLGEDRRRFLNGMITADVAGLEPGRSRYGLFSTLQGRIMSDATILAHGDRLWIRVPASQGSAVRGHLEKFVITDRVDIMPLADMVPVVVVGAGALEQVARWTGGETLEPGEHRRLEVLDTEVCALRETRFPIDAVSLWVSAGIVRDLLPALLDGSDAPQPVGFEALERLRVERGVPRFGCEFGSDTFPQEAGLDDAVSYEKGCYLGQEVIARIHYRGGVQRQLMRIELDDGAGTTGESLSFEGRDAGRVTSVARRFQAEGWVGMAMLAKRVTEPGSVVSLADGRSARVLSAVGADS